MSTEVKEGAFVLQVKFYKLSQTMIFLSSWWNDCKKRKGSRLRSGRSGRKPISTCKCRSVSLLRGSCITRSCQPGVWARGTMSSSGWSALAALGAFLTWLLGQLASVSPGP
jgi:hypothetical protein